MPRAQRQTVWRRLAGSKWLLYLGLIVVFLILLSFGRELLQRFAVNDEIRSLNQQVAELQKKKSDLTNLIQYFESPLFQEQQGREKLGLAKPGESVVIVPTTPATNADANATTTTDAAPKRPNPAKWWDYFFSNPKDHSQT